jgi:hypothetical protein
MNTTARAYARDEDGRADAHDRHTLHELMRELAVTVHRLADLRRWTPATETAHLDTAIANAEEAIRALQLEHDRRTGTDPATPAEEDGPVVTVAENPGNLAAGHIALHDPHAAPGERGPLAWFIGCGSTDRPRLKFDARSRVLLNVDGARRLAEELTGWADIHQPQPAKPASPASRNRS